MLPPLDTGACAPESESTLLYQQQQLNSGKRAVQMFPVGTKELPLPDGISRHVNPRGVFHYRAEAITPLTIDTHSAVGRENEFLMLGKYSKIDILRRIASSEEPSCITEHTSTGVEVRTAAATQATLAEQLTYFNETKDPDTVIVVGILPDRVKSFLTEGKS